MGFNFWSYFVWQLCFKLVETNLNFWVWEHYSKFIYISTMTYPQGRLAGRLLKADVLDRLRLLKKKVTLHLSDTRLGNYTSDWTRVTEYVGEIKPLFCEPRECVCLGARSFTLHHSNNSGQTLDYSKCAKMSGNVRMPAKNFLAPVIQSATWNLLGRLFFF